jgi:NitT/TauT family transport system substrate-binding protein
MAHINIEFTLFSAFYSPLISVMSGGFLEAEGLEADWTVSPPGVSAVKALEEGRADVIQSAPSQAFTSLAKGETPTASHFAQINEMDGFFITGRAPDPDFDWKKLEGSEVILFGGGQPLAMFKYACHKAGIDFAKLKVIGVGGAEDMDKAFREGKGQYVQQQGALPAAARGQWSWAHRCAMRSEDRTCRFFEPRGDAGLVAIRCRQGLHARLYEDTRLHAGYVGN